MADSGEAPRGPRGDDFAYLLVQLGFHVAGAFGKRLAPLGLEPRHFGMHDPMIAPVTCAGSASLRYLLIGGRTVVENGAIPGLDIQKLKSDAARVVARLAA